MDFYVLVCMDKGQCFVLTSAEMDEVLMKARSIYGEVRLVIRADIPNNSLNAWDKIIRPPEPKKNGAAIQYVTTIVPGSPKTVRKTLADGTVKTYEYARNTKNTTIRERLDMRRA